MKTHLVRLVGAFLFATMLLMSQTESASAGAVHTLSGRPGAVSLNGPMITAYDSAVRVGQGGYWITRTFGSANVSVGRSPSYSGSQYAIVQLHLQYESGGRWYTWKTSNYQSGLIGANGWRFPGWSYDPENQPHYKDLYRVVYRIGWFNANTGRIVSAVDVVPNRGSDNLCSTRYSTCSSGWDGVYF